MKYRVVNTIAPACTVTEGIYSNFEEAYKKLQQTKLGTGYARVEKKVKGGWKQLTSLEIAKKNVKKVEYKKIKITTSTDTYIFNLPRPVAVPSNMDQANAALYITLDLLGIKPTVKHKKDDGVY